jgi:hypothetical protein
MVLLRILLLNEAVETLDDVTVETDIESVFPGVEHTVPIGYEARITGLLGSDSQGSLGVVVVQCRRPSEKDRRHYKTYHPYREQTRLFPVGSRFDAADLRH